MKTELKVQEEERQLAALRKSPEQYFAVLRPKTFHDVFTGHEPSVAAVVARYGVTFTRAMAGYLVAECSEFFNVTKPMTEMQIAVTTELIIEEYPYFTVADLKLCFKNAMKGRYGEIYNRIDGSVIMGWLRRYNVERCTEADRISYGEHKGARESEASSGMLYDEYRKVITEMAEAGDEEAAEALRRSDEVMEFMRRKSFEKKRKELEEFYRNEEVRDKMEQ